MIIPILQKRKQAQKGEATSLRSHSLQVVEPEVNPGSFNSSQRGVCGSLGGSLWAPFQGSGR